jgi:hypothetical protein
VPSNDRRRAAGLAGMGRTGAGPYVTTASGINPANSQLVCFEAKAVGDRALVRRPETAG